MDNKKVLSIYVQMNVYCLIFHGILRHACKIWIKAWLASCLRKQYIPFRVSQAQLRVKNVEIPFKPIFAHFSHSIQFSQTWFNELKRGVDFGYQQNGALLMSKDLKEDERRAQVQKYQLFAYLLLGICNTDWH